MRMGLAGALLFALGCCTPKGPPALLPAAESALLAYKLELSDAGDRGKCDEAKARVQHAMAVDKRLADSDLQAEIDHYERVKGTMPYPSPGTACSLFGFQAAAHGALQERKALAK